MIELLQVCNMVDKKEIEDRILKALEGPYKNGILTEKLGDKIGMTNSSDRRKFYDVLNSLKKKGEVLYKRRGKSVINYLPMYEKNVVMHWEFDEKNVKISQELKKIHAGFVIVEKGVITQREGAITSLDSEECSENFIEAITSSSILDLLVNEKDDADLLIFAVENNNNYPINDFGANIYVSDIFYQAGDYRLIENCHCKKNGNVFHIKCDELFPLMMTYVVIPLSRSNNKFVFKDKEKEKEFYSEHKPCEIQAWYKTNPIEVKGGKVSKQISGSNIVIEIMGKNQGHTAYF